MNPIKEILFYLKNILKDIYEDIKFIVYTFPKKLKNNERIVDPEKWKEYKKGIKSITAKEFFSTTWYWVIAIIFALVIGMVGSAKFYQLECNNFIVENYINDVECRSLSTIPFDFSGNESISILPFGTQNPEKQTTENGYKNNEPPD